MKLKYIIDTLNSGTAITNDKLSDADDESVYPVYGGGSLIGFYHDFNVECTLLVGRVGAKCGCITFVPGKAWATDNALVVNTQWNIPWLNYVLIASDLNKLNTSNAQPLITASKVLNLHVAVCEEAEQQEIVTYLNDKCAALDTLIAKKTALLTELETYKKSLIYEYVTGKKAVPVAARPAATVYPFYPAVLNTKVLRFAQAVLMARIIDKHGKGIGRVKLEKMLYTIETSIGFDFDTEYVREVAGPLHESLYQCEGIIATRNHWYQKRESDYGVSYTPTHAVERYRSYYDKYFTDYDAEIERIIDIFRPYNTDQAEIIATLFAAWNDAIIDGKSFTDEDIVDDVLNNWHDSKKRFPKDVWFRAMEQMRKHNLVPRGYGKHTIIRRNPV